MSQKILIISIDSIGEYISGAGMRYLSLAEQLSRNFDVILAVPNSDYPKIDQVEIVSYDQNKYNSLDKYIFNADFVLLSGYLIEKISTLEKTSARIIVDLYDPFILENLFYWENLTLDQRTLIHLRSIEFTNKLVQKGDFFICGSEKQRDFWLGVLAANYRINPLNYINDTNLRELIDVVGIGIPNRQIKKGNYLIGSTPEFGKNAKIVLWGGGLWDWLDPMPLIKIWPEIVLSEKNARLVFLGTKHPNPNVPYHRNVDKIRAEAEKIGELNKTIFLLGWISLEERERLFSEAWIGVTLQKPTVESRFSIRTRMIDYFWAGLPALTNKGDVIAEWVERYHLGEVVEDENYNDLTEKLKKMLATEKEEYKMPMNRVREFLSWDKIIQPLENYCHKGQTAPDRSMIKRIFPKNRIKSKLKYFRVALLFKEAKFLFKQYLKRILG